MKKKVVLAYSGGLDTSYCAARYGEDPEIELHTVCVNTGGFSQQELQQLEERALACGSAVHQNIDAKEALYDQSLCFLLFGNVLKNQTYPLSVSAERAIQARFVAEYAAHHGAFAIAHGSTGAGNDQVRFDLIFQAICPEAEIWTPVRDEALSRAHEIAYLTKKGIHVNAEKALYSINQGIWGTSVGGVETLNSLGALPEEAWPTQVSKNAPEELIIAFEQGHPVSMNGVSYAHPVGLIEALHKLAAPFGIGRDIHVGDTIIGIKGRVGFEAAAPLILIKAHHLLEKHVLSKWQLSWKEQLASFYGNWLHEGQLMDPVMRDMEAFLKSSQERVSGEVHIKLLPYRFELLGISSPFDLMQAKFGSYGESNTGWTGEDVRGFTRIFGNQARIWSSLEPINKQELE